VAPHQDPGKLFGSKKIKISRPYNIGPLAPTTPLEYLGGPVEPPSQPTQDTHSGHNPLSDAFAQRAWPNSPRTNMPSSPHLKTEVKNAEDGRNYLSHTHLIVMTLPPQRPCTVVNNTHHSLENLKEQIKANYIPPP
jgi:hypothetical protein